MARTVETLQRAPAATTDEADPALATGHIRTVPPSAAPVDQDKVLPLPEWLKKVYFIFPVVLYIPDVIFNFYVYSHGITTDGMNPLIQGSLYALWGFLSVGVVGMAYLLSVLAPWHWGQGHRIQAFFCGLGVLIATFITTWNSLAYRSQELNSFSVFKTDEWVNHIWPQLQANNISVTMILVAVAPPFWGLFWAIVQPTETGRNLRQLQESHAERLLRLQQESELKRVKAETNAKIREAQLRGMASTAAAARAQAKGLFAQTRTEKDGEADATDAPPSDAETTSAPDGATTDSDQTLASLAPYASGEQTPDADNIFKMARLAPPSGRELAGARGATAYMSNHAAAASPSVHAAPSSAGRTPASQPLLMSDADVRGVAGVPESDTVTFTPRRPAMLGDAEALTGTTGPRPAVRRPTDQGTLTQRMNGQLSPAHVQAVQEVLSELGVTISKRGSLVGRNAKEVPSRLAERLNLDASIAKIVIGRYIKMLELNAQ